MKREYLHELHAVIKEKSADFRKLSEAVWNRPELAFNEVFACAEQVSLLRGLGFQVTTPAYGIQTAYRAEWGNSSPAFAFAAEYDALPGIGHGCGHNLICTAGGAAAYALMTLMEKYQIPGRVVLLGTPAEEGGGGKVKMLEEGCLDGVDAAMMVHPFWRTTPDSGGFAIRQFEVEFFGKSAHASGSPELGLSALDAVNLTFNAISAWRQMLTGGMRIHGIITDGGEAPNIIPAHAACSFHLRALEEEVLDKMEKRFRDIVHGAELMTGTTAKISPEGVPYMSRVPNRELNEMYMESAKELDMNPIVPENPGIGCSDFGNFSHKVPATHVYFGIADHEIPAHSSEFAQAAHSDFAFERTLSAAAAMAGVALRFLQEPEFRQNVQKAFVGKHA